MDARDDAASELLAHMLARSNELLEALGSVFNDDGFEGFGGSPQGVAALCMCSLALEHGQALRTLFATGCPTAAASLMRLQFAAVARAMWFIYAAKRARHRKAHCSPHPRKRAGGEEPAWRQRDARGHRQARRSRGSPGRTSNADAVQGGAVKGAQLLCTWGHPLAEPTCSRLPASARVTGYLELKRVGHHGVHDYGSLDGRGARRTSNQRHSAGVSRLLAGDAAIRSSRLAVARH